MLKKIFVALVLLLGVQQANASHIMGGEITWECLPSGQYVIHMKIYRDCNGIALSGTETVTIRNYPTVGNSTTVSMPMISSTDVSPDCSPWPGATQLSCGAGPPFAGSGGNGDGAVQENVYESAPVTLNGTPPPQGWVFTWNSCCRNNAIDNLVGPSGLGHTLRAIMYPYTPPGSTTPQAANPCYDSSPEFRESPSTVICTGYPFTYNHNASDPELDSLYYAWAEPLDEIGIGGSWNPPTNPNPVPFSSGYTYNSPLPGPAQNPSNVAATIDASSGEVKYTSYTDGSYVTCVVVEAWKCGQKVAEIYRDIQVVLLNCTGTNNPPTVTITATPNSVPVTQIPGSNTYEATAIAGDLVEFTMQALDIEFQPVTFLPQNVTFQASGGQLGVPLSSSTSGCINPPCATVVPTGSQVGFTAAQQNNITFSWQTDCSHLSYETNCGNLQNVYTFVLKMSDDYCPAPAISIGTLKVTVLADLATPPDLTCVSFDPNTNEITLNWIPPTDTGYSFNYYVIYHRSNTPGATFMAVDTVYNWADTQAILTGITPAEGDFMVRSNTHCDYLSGPSDTLTLVDLVVTPYPPTNSEIGFLNWNSMGSGNVLYEIWAESPAGSGSYFLIGTTNDTSFVDTVTFCNSVVNYQIRVNINGVTCNSTVDGAAFSDNTNDDVIVMDTVSVNAANQALVTWELSNSPDVVEYYILRLNPTSGIFEIIDTVDAATYVPPYIDPTGDPTAGALSYKVISVDSCGNQSDDLVVDPHTTMYLNNYLDKCESRNYVSWTTYKGIPVSEYSLYVSITPPGGPTTPKSLIYQGGPADTTFTQPGLQNEYIYCYEVEATDTNGTVFSSSNRLCVTAQVPNKSQVLYLGTVTNTSGGAGIHAFIDGNADVISFDIERADNILGPYAPIGTVAKPAFAPWRILYTDYSANVNQRRYYYRIAATDSCGSRDTVSNLGRNILLEVRPKGNLSNQLKWNPYIDWGGEVGGYRVYRSVDNDYSFELVATVSGSDTTYLDFIDGFPNANGKFCYYVEAFEVNNPLNYVDDNGNGFVSGSNIACTIQEARVFLPTAFYPESEMQVNRLFGPTNVFAQPGTYRFYIMNRWGEMVFETNDFTKLWDGSHNGEPAPVGVYVYYLKFTSKDGLPVEQRGTFTLLR